MPKSLHPQIESMPRQAIYTLASREGELSKKEEIVRNYKGESKQHMISLIRSFFPLKESDKRREKSVENAIKQLESIQSIFTMSQLKYSLEQKNRLLELLDSLKSTLIN